MRICELRQKEVINQCDCRRLGFVSDVEFDICTGQMKAIIVPCAAKIMGIFGKEQEYVIPYSCICQIGEEIILVNAKNLLDQ